jgi:hypothetical protein
LRKRNKSKKQILKIIDQIQKVRSKNNINWMDIIRLSVKHAPNETIKVIKKINSQDKKIANLFKKIS